MYKHIITYLLPHSEPSLFLLLFLAFRDDNRCIGIRLVLDSALLGVVLCLLLLVGTTPCLRIIACPLHFVTEDSERAGGPSGRETRWGRPPKVTWRIRSVRKRSLDGKIQISIARHSRVDLLSISAHNCFLRASYFNTCNLHAVIAPCQWVVVIGKDYLRLRDLQLSKTPMCGILLSIAEAQEGGQAPCGCLHELFPKLQAATAARGRHSLQRPQLKYLIVLIGPDAQHTLCVEFGNIELQFCASELRLRGDSFVQQPHIDAEGNILCWNGEVRPMLSCCWRVSNASHRFSKDLR